MSVADLADLTLWLPPGSALWISVGGPMALSTDQRLLNTIEFRLRVLDWRKTKGTKPTLPADPPYAHERAAKVETIRRKADAYLRRQAKREE
jgi:hypothetical protein